MICRCTQRVQKQSWFLRIDYQDKETAVLHVEHYLAAFTCLHQLQKGSSIYLTLIIISRIYDALAANES